MNKCTFDEAWIGYCGKEADDSGFCQEHKGEECGVCKQQATHTCDHTGQFVCGYSLCANCDGDTDMNKPSGNWGFLNHTHKHVAQ